MSSSLDLSVAQEADDEASLSEVVCTPSKKRKRLQGDGDGNTCRKCGIKWGSERDNKFGSIWINCDARRCNYWVHIFCLGFSYKERDEEEFGQVARYHCPSHNPHKLPRPKTLVK